MVSTSDSLIWQAKTELKEMQLDNVGLKSVLRAARALAFGMFFLLPAVSRSQLPTVSVSPSALTIYPGQQSIPVTVTVGSGSITTPVTVTLTGLPSGITVTPLTLNAGSAGTLYLSASVSAGQEG